MELVRCSYPTCTNRYSPRSENALTTYDELVAIGWFRSENGWLCGQHSPHANSPAAGSSRRPTVATGTRSKSNATQWIVLILVAIVIIVVIAVAGAFANNGQNAAYKAGYGVGYNSNNFVSDGQAGSYCQDLWNNLSGSELSKYGSNESSWVDGCADGVNAAN